ncbi:MAG TPA: 4-hydroxy-3-methylbut-2-enyl diphosphate reductase [Dehalococcoidales bacterium]|nr:4-hydroxy-3-methylbut-2-enyl diphosphate reductase [Dehalococcoidales bacterium]
MKVEKADKTGFCFGVRRAINTLEKIARERGGVETLGEVVHNRQVLQRLAKIGIKVVKNIDDIRGDTVATSSHGVSPQLEEELRARHIDVISTTCPFVLRAQIVARRLADSGFFVVIYGDADHPEVKGILGWTKGKGIATLDENFVGSLEHLLRRWGILSQTTQIPAHFNKFVKKFIDSAFTRDSELRIIDTICHDIRERQTAALKLAGRVDLMLVIGGLNSANTRHLAELCAAVTETYHIETADEIQPSWLQGKNHVGITAGASTAEETVDEVLMRLEE